MKTLKDRLMKHVEIDQKTGCWNWTGFKSQNGYGRTLGIVPGYGPKAVNIGAHRAMYAAHGGKIRKGRPHLDHLCNNPSCVNPDHLEPVTPKENCSRAAKRRTHCKNGHKRKPGNSYKSKGGIWYCKECQRATMNRATVRRMDKKRSKEVEALKRKFKDVSADTIQAIYNHLKPRPKLKGDKQ